MRGSRLVGPVGVAAVIVAVIAVGFWLLMRQAGGRFLPAEAPAEWIVYPSAFNAVSYPISTQTTVFRRTIQVEDAAGPAILTVRGYRRFSVIVNGREVHLSQPVGANGWEHPSAADIGPYLQTGANRLSVEVSNDSGPPALWLALRVGEGWVVSDATWESSRVGATWLPARPATQPPELRPGNLAAGGEQATDALRSRGGTLLFFAALAAAAVLGRARLGRLAAELAPRTSPRTLAFLAIVIVLLALLAINLQSLPFPMGFDVSQHLEYVRYIMERGSLPLASEGFQMHQTPLYYMVSAGLLTVCQATADASLGAVILLRVFGFATLLVGVYLVFRGLERLYPDRPAAQAVGVLLAACLPMHLYLAHYASNDLLAGVLGTAAVYLTVVILQANGTGTEAAPTMRALAGLGLLLGAGILTKLTAVPVAAAVLGVLAVTAVVRVVRSRPRVNGRKPLAGLLWPAARAALRLAGIPLAACLLVCGWFFFRNYLHFGRPIAGVYDPVTGFAWWQDPGFASAEQFWRFGRSLIEPFYSASEGVPDGLYSTCWGDGCWGGTVGPDRRPPWKYELMAAGYLLALVPTALMVIGWVAQLVAWVRRPSAVWGLLLALPVAAAAAIVYQYAAYPYYGHLKAGYALPATMLAASAFLAHGFELVARAGSRVGHALGIALGTWGLTAFAAFVVNPWSANTLAWQGVQRQELVAQDVRTGMADAARALAADPDHAGARIFHGSILLLSGRGGEAADEFRRALAIRPDDPHARVWLARALGLGGQSRAAIAELKQVICGYPDSPEAYSLLAAALDEENNPAETVRVAREGLRILPVNLALHTILARNLLRTNETADAVWHYRFALQCDSEHVPALVGLAWVRAAHEESQFRSGAEAVELATRAAQLNPSVATQRLLAAAYAETGQYQRAVQVAQQALAEVEKTKDAARAEQLRREFDSYKSGKPIREAAKTLAGR